MGFFYTILQEVLVLHSTTSKFNVSVCSMQTKFVIYLLLLQKAANKSAGEREYSFLLCRVFKV